MTRLDMMAKEPKELAPKLPISPHPSVMTVTCQHTQDVLPKFWVT